ncbi:TetR family transcriptional regulator [Embleya sp. NBC_00896]|uniref:TetR/AcrR family transcriptional regulator n=1 Tax=Embleya sp. NBC_00896 TaxID=2975961 RepID=UPI002F90A348|nr:TetR/AcrR family transcriptional regulator [Embleya sp. NBC_00896]
MTDDSKPRAQRVDARRNRELVLDVARTVFAEQGTDASLRDIARRAGVGMGTFYRHFPTRDALLEAVLRHGFDTLAARAGALAQSPAPDEALTAWLRDFTAGTTIYTGLPASLVATLTDEESALHASCLSMRQAGGRLLTRAQEAGHIRPDVTATDLFALISALGWVTGQAPTIGARREQLFGVLMDGLAGPGARPEGAGPLGSGREAG